MPLELTPEQVQELLQLVHIGMHVRGGDGTLEKMLRDRAIALGVWAEAGDGASHAALEDYEDDRFWSELATDLGKRDFEREMTDEDAEYMSEHEGMLPERVEEYYQKYEKEFDIFGLDRIEINKNAPVADMREVL